MRTHPRPVTSALGLLAAAAVFSGCVAPPDQTIPAEPGPAGPPSTSVFELDAAWLDAGRMAAVVTYGSSSCAPFADKITADGQTVRVTLDEGDPHQPCTDDYTGRASSLPLPEGIDPTQDVELVITLGDVTGEVGLRGSAALTGTPGEPTDYEPSAGWLDGTALVLLTWGSSSCPPMPESFEASGNSGTITFVTDTERICTADMGPRLTLVDFGELDDGAKDDFTLTLVGDNLDGELTVYDG